jgi:hypothetical protein
MISPDSTVVIRISVRSKTTLDQPVVGILFRNQLGVDFAGANTTSEGRPLPPLAPGETCTVDFYVDIPTLYSTSLAFCPAVSNGPLERYTICDFIENAVVLEMSPPEGPLYGPFRFPCRVQVNSRLGSMEERAGEERAGALRAGEAAL